MKSIYLACTALLVFVGVAVLPRGALRAQEPAALHDGPYVFHGDDGAVTAKWVTAGQVDQKRFAPGEPVRLPAFAALLGTEFEIAAHQPERAVYELPEKVLALSDVEGRYDELLRFLTANGVVDAKGAWAFGGGHLVCVGDMVDRGTQVTETLWLMYRLEREARAAGGRVHYVLGNHEAMLMGGDVRYVAPKYHRVAKLFGVPVEGLVGADTELGRWMRTRNSVIRLGRWVFVHAGLSPAVAAEGAVDLDAQNAKIRSVLGVPPGRIDDKDAGRLVWSRRGPLWYRGYFEEYAAKVGGVPSAATTDRILANVGGKHIVVGHTKVRRVTPLIDGRVVAIDIPWTRPEDVRGLFITGAKVETVDIEGNRAPVELPERD